MRYIKPTFSHPQLLEILKDWGVEVLDETEAVKQLEHMEFFKYKTYCIPLRTYFKDEQVRISRDRLQFSDVIELYNFDRKLRFLVLDALEKIELSLRSSAVRHLAITYGAVGYVDDILYKSEEMHKNFLNQLNGAIKSRINHGDSIFREFKEKYPGSVFPPLWMSVEVMTFGMLTRWLDDLSKRSDRHAIASRYGVNQEVFFSIFKNLVLLRNVCAHHEPIWNFVFAKPYKLPRKPELLSSTVNPSKRRFLYNTLVVLCYLSQIISPISNWKERLIAVLDEQSVIDLAVLGFPENWKKRPLWEL